MSSRLARMKNNLAMSKIRKLLKSRDFLAVCFLAVLDLLFFRNFLFGSKMIYGGDIVGLNFPIEQFITDAFKSGKIPLWNPYAAAGYPFLPFSPTFYPLNIIFRILPTYLAFNYTYILHFLIAGVSMYFLLKHFKVGRLGALVSAIVFMFNGYFAARIFAGHYMLIQALAWFPLLFLLLEKVWETRKIVYAALAGLIFSFVALLGHPQPLVYLCYTLIIYFSLRFLVFRRDRRSVKRNGLLLILVLIFGLALSAVTLLPSLEAVLLSLRGGQINYAAATSYSLSPKQLITFFLPDFWGSYAASNYRGGAIYHEIAVYLGLIPLALAGLAVWKKRSHKIVLTFAALSVLSVFFAFGYHNPLYKLVYHLVPGFSSLRVPARILMIYVFSTSVLAGFGADTLSTLRVGKKTLRVSLGIGAVLLTLIVADLFYYGSKFLVPADPEVYLGRNELVQFLQKDEEKYFRTYLLPNTMLFNRGNVYKFFDNQSDTSLTLGVYSDLVEMFKARDPNLNQAGERAIIRINNSQLLTLLNTKYVISEGGIGDSEESYEIAQPKINLFSDWDQREPTKIFKEVHVYERYRYLPRAFMVYKSRVLNSKDEIEEVLTSEEFDPFTEVILEEGPETLRVEDSEPEGLGSAEITPYDINNLTVEVDNPADGFLVLSEIYYPGWKAFVDGRETKIYKADYALRAIHLLQGQHKIHFTFDPLSFKIGALFSILSFATLTAICVNQWRASAKSAKISGL